MKKSLFILIAAIASILPSRAALTADWRIHQTFDAWPIAVYDTPKRVYFVSRTFELKKAAAGRDINSYVVNYYDKEGDEVLTISTGSGASGNAVECVAYNPDKGYLLVVYTDHNIDFIYDDGKIYNLPALMATTIPGKKSATSVTFDPENNHAYVATEFGYVVLNDKKHEVAESRNYGRSISSVARCGDNIVLATDNRLYVAPKSEMRYNFDEYSLLENDDNPAVVTDILPFSDGSFVALRLNTSTTIYRFTPTGGKYERTALTDDPAIFNYQKTKEGYAATGNVRSFIITPNECTTLTNRPQDRWKLPAINIDKQNLWTLEGRKGLRHYKKENNEYVLVKDFMRPNAPATYISTSAAYHPDYGMLMGSIGIEGMYFETNQSTPSNLSALKGGFWKEYSPLYTNEYFSQLTNYYGISIDPNDTKYVYRNALLGGFMRINMEDPDDVMIFANAENKYNAYKGFVNIFPTQNAWNVMCKVTTPQFDNEGRMWTGYNNYDSNQLLMYYWSAADRKATTDKQTYRGLKSFKVPDYTPSNTDFLTVLRHSQNKNILAIGCQYAYGRVFLYDHNGTPDNTSDDRYADVHFPYDQDGGSVNFLALNGIVEDPETGLIWILAERGLFTLNPVTAFENPNSINRIKVARNDGTNLADYLLNEVNVYSMCIDGEGRKWFGTANGLVCTSSDGKTILGEFTPQNSLLPDDNVYSVAYNPENKSIMLGTGKGVVELFPSGSGGTSTSVADGVRIYPNPVEPDFYGYVRIDNIPEGSLVKITDASGGIVKEMGPVAGGSVEWDVSGLNNRRVNTGVYYVMVSPGSAGGQTSINKILVLN